MPKNLRTRDRHRTGTAITGDRILSPARLPIPPPGHTQRTSKQNCFISGAGDEARTRDLNLGKVALYQLSYSRICLFERLGFISQLRCKYRTVFFLCKCF